MARRLAGISVRLVPVLLYVAATAGCGGDASSQVRLQAQATPSGPAVSGVVSLPNAQLAQAERSVIERVAAWVVETAEALTASNVLPARNVEVKLSFMRCDGVVQALCGEPGSGLPPCTFTIDQGQYRISLPAGATEDAPNGRFMVFVGDSNAATLTRAFVFTTTESVNVDFVSETAVALMLGHLETNLCRFSPADIRGCVDAVRRAPGTVTGSNVRTINESALDTATSDPDVQQACGGVSDTPTPLPPTATATKAGSPTIPPPTFTRIPTSTATTAPSPTATRTNTAPPTATLTPSATRTNTRPPTATPTFTNTLAPTATPTETEVPTEIPTDTPTETPTETEVPTAADTPTATETETPVGPTETVTPGGPAVDVGSAAGTAGATLPISVALANSGGLITATSNDIVYDSTLVNVALKQNGKPDCTINSAIDTNSAVSKSLAASQPTSPANAKILRVGIIGTDNANIIPDGLLFTCNFVIAEGVAPGTNIELQNTPGASDASANPVDVGGTGGTIIVAGVTATATPTATPPANAPAVNVGNGSGLPGNTVAIGVTLANGGGVIAATSNDIVYDSTLVNVALKQNGKPDCTINAAIDTDSAVSKSLVASQPTSPADAKILRVGIIGTDNANIIPDGLLFTCNFTIAAGATPGAQLILHNTPGASDASANPVAVVGTDGSIAVTGAATPTQTPVANAPAIDVGIGSGPPGGTVPIAVTLANGGGLIAATSNDIVYDSTLLSVALKGNGKPDCTINQDIGTDSAVSKSLVASQPSSPADAKILRVGIIGTDNANIIPDGLLFTCNFTIPVSVTPGALLVLHNTPGASDASAHPVVVVGTDGSVAVTGGATPTEIAATPTATPPPAATATQPLGGPAINIGAASGAAAAAVSIEVSLVNGGGLIAATSNDIVYDSTQVNVGLKLNGKPDCTINAAINTDSAVSKSLVASQPTSPASAKILRVGIIGTDNANIIPDGLLFTCNFTIAAGANAGMVVLHNTPGASDAAASPVAVGGSDGSITIGGGATSTPTLAPPTPTPTQALSGPAINLGTAAGAVNSPVVITATLVNSGGLIAATSNDIVYDSTRVNVGLKLNGKPDCTISALINTDSAVSKSLVASQPTSPANAKILRVGIIGTDNANIIPDGPLFSCNFIIASDAPLGVVVLNNTPGASDAGANPVTVVGANGSITVQ